MLGMMSYDELMNKKNRSVHSVDDEKQKPSNGNDQTRSSGSWLSKKVSCVLYLQLI